jgi:Flp pilus assembly protein TadG
MIRMSRRKRLGSLARDTSGLALVEFAFTLPIIIAMGGWGVELSYFALCNLRVSQYAMNLADNSSRVGVAAAGGVTQLREADINDVLQGTRKESAVLNLTTNGRVTLSSLIKVRQSYDNATAPRIQRIHWQRCIGVMAGTGYDSTYGTTTASAGSTNTLANAGTPAPTGMGPVGRKVEAFQDSGVMFVEINYRYRPLFGSLFIRPQIIHYAQSYVVRDNRDFTRVYNDPTTPAPVSSCDKYTV